MSDDSLTASITVRRVSTRRKTEGSGRAASRNPKRNATCYLTSAIIHVSRPRIVRLLIFNQVRSKASRHVNPTTRYAYRYPLPRAYFHSSAIKDQDSATSLKQAGQGTWTLTAPQHSLADCRCNLEQVIPALAMPPGLVLPRTSSSVCPVPADLVFPHISLGL